MPFGLYNAPASVQAMINQVLCELLDEEVIDYRDDILIYSETEEEYIRLVSQVLEKLKKANWCVAINNSRIHVKEVDYLGNVISDKGISLSPEMIRAVKAWKALAPTSTSAVKWAQEFLGFGNSYRRFIEGFSKMAKHLTNLTKKNQRYEWTPACEQAFDTLKSRFCEAPILVHFLSGRPTAIETNASDYALGAVMSQECEDGRLLPVAFHSRKLQPAEINYHIYDKELLAIVAALKEWEHMLKSYQEEFTVFTDHKNLEYFTFTKVLSRRQARWAEFLSEFWFKVVYRPGHLNSKEDVLSRRRDYTVKDGGEPIPKSLFKPGQWVVNFAHIAATKAFALPVGHENNLKAAGKLDPNWIATLEAVRARSELVAPGFTEKDRLLLFENRYVLPNDKTLKLAVLSAKHDSKVAGHFGQFKTLERIR